MRTFTLLVVVGVLLGACHAEERTSHSASAPASTSTGVVTAPNGVRCTGFMTSTPGYSCYEERSDRPGVRCSGYVPPSPQHSREPTPPTIYSAAEIGRPGVPRLSAAEMRELVKAEDDMGARDIHFVFLPHAYLGFVIFNATRGVCADWAGGYPVLNDNPGGRLFYEPGDDPNVVHSSPS